MKKYIITLLSLCTIFTAAAQSTLKSSYFMDRMAMSHKLNPSFINEQGYVSIPMLGDLSFGTKSNLALNQFLFPLDNGKLGTFLHEDVSADQFLGSFSDNNYIMENFNMSILSTGFFGFGGFNTIDLSFKQNFTANLSKSMFEMFKVGQNGNTSYNINNTQFNLNSYAELAFGHARRLNENITVGAKVKVLFGAAYADVLIDKMNVTMSEDKWAMDLAASGNVAMLGSSISDFDSIEPKGLGGFGLAVDLGITYENLIENLTLSAAITDLGYISYSSPSKIDITASTEFTGFNDLDIDDFDGSTEGVLDGIEDDLTTLTDPEFIPMSGSCNASLFATVNVGAEYELFDGKLSAGLLSSTTFAVNTLTDVMLSANYKPVDWFNMAITGTASNYGTYWGWVLNLCPSKGLNLFVGMDHMVGSVTPQFIPINKATMDFSFGLNIPLGNGSGKN